MTRGHGDTETRGKVKDDRRDNRPGFFPASFLIFLIFIAALTFSCKGKEAQPEKKQAAVENPYSSETIFQETKRMTEAHPEDADAWMHLADLYERNKQYAEAIEVYKKVSKLSPTQGYVYLKMGTAYDQIGKPRDAVESIEKAIRYMPRYAVAYNNLGIAYGKMGKGREEIAALKKAIQLRPKYITARYNLGIAYLRVNDKKAALQQYEFLKDIESGTAEELKKEIDKKQ